MSGLFPLYHGSLCLWVLYIECDWANFVQAESHVVQFERPQSRERT